MSKNIDAKCELNLSVPDDKRYENKTEKQRLKLVEKTVRSVCRFGNLKVTNVKITIKK